MEIDQAWAENYYVVKANLMHERVHDPQKAYQIRGKKVLTAVRVFDDRPAYHLYGVVDCLEATPSPTGVLLEDGKRYDLCIVEYKPSMPKEKPYLEEDAMQVFAQKICVDAIFDCRCRCVLYYASEKKRVELPFDAQYESYDAKLRATLTHMREDLRQGIIPPRRKGQKCSGCSMIDLCMPKHTANGGIRQRIQKMMEEGGL